MNMAKTTGWTAEDWMGAWAVAMLGGGASAFRALAIDPLYTVGMCAAANAPAICAPRHLMLVGAYLGVFGWAALALGLLAFFRNGRFLGAVAIGIGIAAVVNYDGTRGIIGATFGLIAWLSAITGRTAKTESLYV
jgi:hypothetical protein